MKAVIFNSGLGKRMGKYTECGHKSMVRINSGESIFERQLRLLSLCGITEFVVTVGPFKEQLMDAAKAPHLSHCSFTFVENPVYDSTNYIYSMYLAREHMDDDVLLLHGDLVFDRALPEAVLACKDTDCAAVNRSKSLPEKDFKARIKNGCVQEVSIKIFDEDCFAFQPMYKLSRATVGAWLAKVCEFVERGETGVYAENAMNEIFPTLNVKEFSCEDYYIDEIDCPEDLERVSAEIRPFDFREQPVYRGSSLAAITDIIAQHHAEKPLVVCDAAFEHLSVAGELKDTLKNAVYFSDFTPNPRYEDVVRGVELMRAKQCDIIIAVGGGSAIDTAKVIKLFSADEPADNYLACAHRFSPVPLAAVPTTAGTGSESTRFAVIYYNGVKQSVTHDSILPDYAVLDCSLLATLPLGQKKATLLDALCQAIESMWSVNANADSTELAMNAICLIDANYAEYLDGDEKAAAKISEAANLAGRAINITQTTAAHAMSYKITSLFGIPHGAAVALCLPEVWKFIANHTSRCGDRRGKPHLDAVLIALELYLGGLEGFMEIYDSLDMPAPPACSDEQLELMTASVNPERLGNNPVTPDADELREMYKAIFTSGGQNG